ncbi:hypothetical protein CW749_09255 [Vibrio sp. vnigr-6D03]|nr:hypothetical protein CW749_09255 [Vibrio sp. vnigr-6D03]
MLFWTAAIPKLLKLNTAVYRSYLELKKLLKTRSEMSGYRRKFTFGWLTNFVGDKTISSDRAYSQGVNHARR